MEIVTIKSDVGMKWEMVKLGDVLDYEQPTNYIVSSDLYDDDFDTPVLTAGKSFILGYTNETDGVFSNLPVIIFDDFTTVSKYVDFPFKVKSSAMKILRAKEGAADIRYMFYLLQTLNVDSEQHKRYWISTFAPLQIPLPPLPIQKRIAEILDAADALKRKDQQLLQKYDELAQAIFIDMFGDPVKNEKGWDKKKLGSILDVDAKAVNPSNLKEYNYVGLEHIEKETGKILVIDKGEVISNKFIFSKEHILYGKLRPYLNKVATPDFNGICSTDIFPLKPKNGLMKEFLVSILRSKDFVNHSNTNAVGANLPRANKETILNYKTIVPDTKTIKEFAKSIVSITFQKNMVESQIMKSEYLFQTLLQKAFKGELVA
jgi:type I restriction enzyme S subunit